MRGRGCSPTYPGTSHRPTPLQHWVFPAGGSGLHLVLDEAGRFKADAPELGHTRRTGSGTAGPQLGAAL